MRRLVRMACLQGYKARYAGKDTCQIAVVMMLNPELPGDVLARRTMLPLKPESVTLEGRRVRLVPLDIERDAVALYAVMNGSPITLGERHLDAYNADELIWRYLFAGPFADVGGMEDYLRVLMSAPDALPMCVFDRASGRQIGIACFMSNAPAHLKIELGSISYSPIVQGTGANTEATYLMLRHAFDLGYRRLEWKCNALNERSRHSALRMGFQFEGIQEYHMVIKGRSRDTAWFRILDHEWKTSVKTHLENLLDR
jgi:RimJ/RimL family protein N-acetyltransferase